VLGHELGVQEHEAGHLQPRNQVHERDLRSVARPAEHALAEEGPPQADAVEPADQFIVPPALDAVSVAEGEQVGVHPLDRPIDPGLGAPLGGGAGLHHLGEGGVDADLEGIGPHRAGQPARDVESVQGDHPPPLRVDQEYPVVLPGVGHREDASRVAAEQLLRAEPGGHWAILPFPPRRGRV